MQYKIIKPVKVCLYHIGQSLIRGSIPEFLRMDWRIREIHYSHAVIFAQTIIDDDSFHRVRTVFLASVKQLVHCPHYERDTTLLPNKTMDEKGRSIRLGIILHRVLPLFRTVCMH